MLLGRDQQHLKKTYIKREREREREREFVIKKTQCCGINVDITPLLL